MTAAPWTLSRVLYIIEKNKNLSEKLSRQLRWETNRCNYSITSLTEEVISSQMVQVGTLTSRPETRRLCGCWWISCSLSSGASSSWFTDYTCWTCRNVHIPLLLSLFKACLKPGFSKSCLPLVGDKLQKLSQTSETCQQLKTRLFRKSYPDIIIWTSILVKTVQLTWSSSAT